MLSKQPGPEFKKVKPTRAPAQTTGQKIFGFSIGDHVVLPAVKAMSGFVKQQHFNRFAVRPQSLGHLQ